MGLRMRKPPATPLECTLTENALVSPVDATLTKSKDLKFLGMTFLQKIPGVGRGCPSLHLPSLWDTDEHPARLEQPTEPAQQKKMTRTPLPLPSLRPAPSTPLGASVAALGQVGQAERTSHSV